MLQTVESFDGQFKIGSDYIKTIIFDCPNYDSLTILNLQS